MFRIFLLISLCTFILESFAFAQSFDFIRIAPGGHFRNSVLWTPFDPVGPPPVLGPGDADDDVIFRLNFPDTDAYTIQNVNGVNDQLIVENDSLILEITDYELTSSGGSENSSIVVGRNNGDVATITFTGGSGATLNSVRTRIGLLAGATGTVNIQGAFVRWENQERLSVGGFGTGTLNISDSANVVSDRTVLGGASSGNGTLSVNGFGSSLFNTGLIEVGTFGPGMLDINTGASVSASSMILGFFSGDGLVTLSGGLTNLNLDGLTVGHQGTGTIDISAGADLSEVHFLDVAERIGSVGTIFIDGAASTLTCDPTNGLARIGVSGSGVLDITNGGEMSAGSVILGYEETGSGVVKVQGSDSVLSITEGTIFPQLGIGFAGTGEMSVEQGATVNTKSVFGSGTCSIGNLNGSSGNLLVRDVGTTFLGDFLNVGEAGTGTASISEGGVIDYGTVVLGRLPGSSGDLQVDGFGSKFLSQNIELGWSGIGILSIFSGGLTECSQLKLGVFSGSSGIATIDGATSCVDVSNFLIVGEVGMGALTIQNGGCLEAGGCRIGFNVGGAGEMLVTGSGTSYQSGISTTVGHQGAGSLIVDDNALVTCPDIVLGVAAVAEASLQILNQSSVELISIEDSELILGNLGTACCEISSGSTLSCDQCMVAKFSGAIGDVVVSGNGSELNVNQTLAIGGDADGEVGGSATVTISGTSSFGATINVGDEVLIYPGGELNLEEGRLNAGAVIMLGGIFDFQGGRLNTPLFSGDLSISGGVIAPNCVDSGNTVITGDLTLLSDATLEFDLGGTIPNDEHDFVNVAGTAVLGGDLKLQFIDGYVPDTNHTLTVFNAGNTLGFFNNVSDNQRLDTADGSGSFLVRYGPTSPNPNQIVLSEFQPSGGGTLYGDVNLDGSVNLLDVAPFIDRLATGNFQEEADTNMDGSVNLLDVDPFIALLAG